MADPGPPASDRERFDTHETHDPELIVALLDADIGDADRAGATALLAECRSCADLHADLVALARASRDIPTPTRPRDFFLTAAMAESLGRATAGEPLASATRLSSEMNDSRSRHATHDRLLIANLIDRSVDEAERARAEELLAACRECEQLYDDLVALGAATRSMLVPARPRDFALTVADADRLRVRGWRRLLGAIGSSRDAFSRPLALGLSTLGIAGLLVATVPSMFMASGPTSLSAVGTAIDGGSGGAANPEMAAQASEAPPPGEDRGPSSLEAAPPAAASAAADAHPAPTDEDLETYLQNEPDGIFVGGESSPLAGEPLRDDTSRTLASGQPVDRSTMITVAGLLLVAGVGLFLLRWTARRLGDG